MSQGQKLLRGNWATQRRPGPRPHLPLRDSWQVCLFLILHFRGPFEVSKELDGVL